MKKLLIIGFLAICAAILLSASKYSIAYTTYVYAPSHNAYSTWITSKVEVIQWSKPDSADCIKHAKEDALYKGLACDSISCGLIEKDW